MNWSEKFAHRHHSIKPSTIREILKLTQKSKVISFAGGLPAPALFPLERLNEASQTVLKEKGTRALQYSTTEGYYPLRQWIAGRTKGAEAEQVQIISGSQQGLDLVGKVLLDPGDKVVVAAPTYMGALRAFDAYEANYLSVDCDEHGMLPDALETALKENPKLIYVIPNFDNPKGTCMNLERRHALIDLARTYNVAIFEDNPYGELRFKGNALPHLFELAPDRVIHAGTFSKIMVPGFRLAWLIADPEVLSLIIRAKQAADLHSATYTQMIAYEVSKDGFMDEQIKRVCHYYHQQREHMLEALDEYFPKTIHWTKPEGGMFLWLSLPTHMNASELIHEAIEKNVAYVPGKAFFANGQGENTLRLSYSVATTEEIHQGIERLSEVFKAHLVSATL